MSYTYICQVCTYVEIIKRLATDTLDRAPYCKYCVIPMQRHYGTVTS